MKSFLINPFTRQITEHEYSGDINEIYRLIDAPVFDCATFNEEDDGVFVDDEGLLKDPKEFFYISKYPQPLAGKGLVIGCDMNTGKSRSPTVTREWLLHNVSFIGVSTRGQSILAVHFRDDIEVPE